MQQRHARRLVDAAALGLDDAVLDLVGHAQPVAAADALASMAQVDAGRRSSLPLSATGKPSSKLHAHFLGAISTAGSQWRTP
jgi:hypothetical protein